MGGGGGGGGRGGERERKGGKGGREREFDIVSLSDVFYVWSIGVEDVLIKDQILWT